MTLPVPRYLQYAMIEFIAHVNAEVNKRYLYYTDTNISIHIHIHIHRKSSAFLDWGITLPVPSDLQYALIEYCSWQCRGK